MQSLQPGNKSEGAIYTIIPSDSECKCKLVGDLEKLQMKQSDKMTDEDRVEKREDSECESKVEVGRVNAQKHTASNQTTAPSRMRQQSIHVSLCSTKNMR